MRLVLVGGGKVGAHLAEELAASGHVVTVIEPDPDRAEDLVDDLDGLVFVGDGTDVGLLESAGIDRADWIVAVTGLDEVNLVACQLGTALGARRALARLNNPKNRATFEALDVPVVAVTDLMAQVISQEVAVTDLSRVAIIGEGRLSVCELAVPDDFPEVPLADLDLPVPSLIVALTRDGDVTMPTADTRLRGGDRVTAVTTVANEAALRDRLNGRAP